MLTLLHVFAMAVWSPAAPLRCAAPPCDATTTSTTSATNAAVEARWAAAWDAPDAPSGPDDGDE